MSTGQQPVKLLPPIGRRDTAISSTAPETQQQLSDRLNEVESRLLFQEDLLNSLNDVIAAQDRQIADMARQIEILSQQLKQGSAGFGGGGDGMAEEPPPHY